MSTIIARSDELRSRGQRVQRMLRPMSQQASGPAYQLRLADRGVQVLSAYDGTRPTSEFRQWRFRTKAAGLVAMYFEIWQPRDGRGVEFSLARAYLQLYELVGPGQEKEILALHCDPDETGDEVARIGRYKQGPHLHFVVAGDPFAKAHIALADGQLAEVLRSAASLTESLEGCVRLIQAELLARLPSR